MSDLIESIKKIEHGFKHIIKTGNVILTDKTQNHFEMANKLSTDRSYQVRMLSVYLLGQLSPKNSDILRNLEAIAEKDTNWRVQEMVAKAFDHYCAEIGYANSLSCIKEWLSHRSPNVRRAVTEGLRIWTARPFFKENPEIAIKLISANKNDESEYLRKSVGNSLRDIRKKHKELVDEEVSSWKIDKRVELVRSLVEK